LGEFDVSLASIFYFRLLPLPEGSVKFGLDFVSSVILISLLAPPIERGPSKEMKSSGSFLGYLILLDVRIDVLV
jgi:hypothetical protein